MTSGEISVVAQPRVDSLVTDVVTGQPMRRTEYCGTIWIGERPRIEGYVAYITGRPVAIETAVFIPDSLPYQTARAGEAVVAATVSMQSEGDRPVAVVDYRTFLVPDPRGGDTSWLQLQLFGAGVASVALSYRIVVQLPADAVTS